MTNPTPLTETTMRLYISNTVSCFFSQAFIALLLSFVMLNSSVNAEENLYLEALPAWQATLSQFVDDEGRIDFIALAEDPANLQTFVDAIAQVSPRSHPQLFPTQDAVLSYHINTYNALAMHGVIERGIPDNFSSFFKRASFFKLRKVKIGGKKTDLYTYENKVIRAIDEPRAHFALNCMVRDCPRLPQEVFEPETLEAKLDLLTREFLSKPKYIRIDHEARVVELSFIFKLYTKDFVESGKVKDLGQYVNQYVEPAIPDDYKVKIMKYDWTINHRPR